MAHVAAPYAAAATYNETPKSCQHTNSYANNIDNLDNHRLSAVSHSAATGPGELGPCGVQCSAGMVPIPIDDVGPCGTLSADTVPISIATTHERGEMVHSGVQYSAESAKFDPNYNYHESGGMAPRGVQHSATIATSDTNDCHYECGGMAPCGVQHSAMVATSDPNDCHYENGGMAAWSSPFCHGCHFRP
jgi:hypothetical protein